MSFAFIAVGFTCSINGLSTPNVYVRYMYIVTDSDFD